MTAVTRALDVFHAPPVALRIEVREDGTVREAVFAPALVPCDPRIVESLLRQALEVEEYLVDVAGRDRPSGRRSPLGDFLRPLAHDESCPGVDGQYPAGLMTELHRAVLAERRLNWSSHSPSRLSWLLQSVRSHSTLHTPRTCPCTRPARKEFLAALEGTLSLSRDRYAATQHRLDPATGLGPSRAMSDLHTDLGYAGKSGQLLAAAGVHSLDRGHTAHQSVHVRVEAGGVLLVQHRKKAAGQHPVRRFEPLEPAVASTMSSLAFACQNYLYFSTAAVRERGVHVETALTMWRLARHHLNREDFLAALETGIGNIDADGLPVFNALADGWSGTLADLVTAVLSLQAAMAPLPQSAGERRTS